MTTIAVEFDGTTFVPQEPVDLPAGTKAVVAVDEKSKETARAGSPPTADDWQAILSQIRATPPDPPTVEEAMRQIRMRP